MENKQIEEMVKATMKHCKIDNQCGSCHWSTCNECLAEVFYNAGYRKVDEVAEEIFAEIERMIYKVLNDQHYFVGDMCWEIAELKKNYTGKQE